MLKITTYLKQLFHKASSDRKLYVYLFCLFLSIFFWLLNALGNSYSTKIIFQVNYINKPKEQVILNDLPAELNIKIRGLGFDLMGYKLNINQPLVEVNLGALKNKNVTDRTTFSQTISTTNFSSDISSQLGEHIDIQDIAPSSIRFIMDKKVEKILPVIPKAEITYAQQYQLFGNIIVKPSAVKVIGAASVLDTLTKIYTEKIILENLSETTNETVSYHPNYDELRLTFVPKKAMLYVPVEKFTETTRTININAINVPDSVELKTIPNEIKVKFVLPLSKMAGLESAIFMANVDFIDINKNYNRKLKVNLVSYPEFIKSIVLLPSKVEYILKKKND